MDISSTQKLYQIIKSLKEKTEIVCINANDDIEKYRGFKLTIIQDAIKGYKGPLAGLHSPIKHYKNISQIKLYYNLTRLMFV